MAGYEFDIQVWDSTSLTNTCMGSVSFDCDIIRKMPDMTFVSVLSILVKCYYLVEMCQLLSHE